MTRPAGGPARGTITGYETGHVCWVVDHRTDYAGMADRFLSEGRAAGRKTVVFGPEGSEDRARLAARAVLVADPYTAFLHGGPLDAEAMFAMFREQSALARTEGYSGLCVVADMDWLLPARPTTDDVVGFELLLDRHIAALDAVVACAYRISSFDTEGLVGARCVHPDELGADQPPQFRLVAAASDVWRLSGEVDLGVASNFAAALSAAAAQPDCVIDVADLEFIDVAGMRVIAHAGTRSRSAIRLRSVPERIRRVWELAGFGDLAPDVELAG